jgi:hypothetical protein
VEWRVVRVEKDLGCAVGTNRSIEMVKDCEWQLHLESDFRHLSEFESGIGKLWMEQATGLIESGLADYIYLRRMRDDREMAMHWFHQWKERITEVRGEFQHCVDFWWSNNPSVFKTQALYDCKTLPLNEKFDGVKGTAGWSLPELSAPRPTRTWMWGYGEGMFVHDG